MDVLQLLKNELRERQGELRQLTPACIKEASGTEWLSRAQAHLSLEKDYLLPELFAVCSKAELSLVRLASDIEVLSSMLLGLRSAKTVKLEKIHAFALAWDGHVELVEDRILPLMRQKIATADREELYDSLQDAKMELRLASVELAM